MNCCETGKKELLQGKVMTVCGLLPAEQMGITLPHEHVLIRHSENVLLDDPDLAVEELSVFRMHKGNTVVDMTNIGLNREPEKMRDISLRANVNIILGTGYYKEDWHPADMGRKSVDDIEVQIVEDISEGMDGTGIKAGVIGEIGISNKSITKNEAKVVTAGARAQRKTGAAISVHFDIGAPKEERTTVLDILEGEGVKLDRVILCHFSKCEDLDVIARLASRGCYIEYDLFMHELPNPICISELVEYAVLLKELIKMGFLENILISQDICMKRFLYKYGGYGYDHLLKNVVPLLLEHGLSEREIRIIMVDNPQRVFPFKFH